MRRLSVTFIFGLLCVLLLSSESLAQFGGGRGGGRGGFDRGQMEQMRWKAEALRTPDVAWLWTALSFDMTLSDEQTTQVKAILKSTWDTKTSYLSDAFERDADWKLMAEEMRDIEKRMDAQIKEVLNKAQEEQLKDLRKKQKKMMDSMRRGGRGGF